MSILVNNSDAFAASTVLLFLDRVHFYDYEKPRRHQTTCIIDNGTDDITSWVLCRFKIHLVMDLKSRRKKVDSRLNPFQAWI